MPFVSYKDAIKLILENIKPVSTTQSVRLQDATGLICAQDIIAKYPLPACTISLKEGYAINYHGTINTYKISSSVEKIISKGHGIKVSTGDYISKGINAVIPIEDVYLLPDKTIKITSPLEKNINIKNKAEDIKVGEIILKKNEFISAYKTTSCAAEGINKLKAYTKPKISVLSIGDQLCPVEKSGSQDSIYNSNAITLGARISEMNCFVECINVNKEDENTIFETLKRLSKISDLVITSGAMSSEDVMNKLLEKKDFVKIFHKVKICPAKPTALSMLDKIPILSLPGLPLSCMLGFEILGIPIINRLKNSLNIRTNFIRTINKKSFTCKASCTTAIPGYFDGICFRSAPAFQAGMLNVLGKCNGYILVHQKKGVRKSQKVDFYPFLLRS
ncbi:MAG: molybdopterin molybdotransferase MoeA [Sulfurospirillaceae bacterium]|nr:molybdopterin molybdotransferase MoeA [Sulfurospirillaceae bacterium]